MICNKGSAVEAEIQVALTSEFLNKSSKEFEQWEVRAEIFDSRGRICNTVHIAYLTIAILSRNASESSSKPISNCAHCKSAAHEATSHLYAS